jgi:hypothetical protein
LKELAEQAGLKTELWHNPEPFVIYKEDPDNPGLEKFAELIVRECINIIKANEQSSLSISNFTGEKKQGIEMGLAFAVIDIEEHFGVE